MDFLPYLFGGCCIYPCAIILSIALWSNREKLTKQNFPVNWFLFMLWAPIIALTLWMLFVDTFLPPDSDIYIPIFSLSNYESVVIR